MSNIITVSYINQIQFLQMPKAFLYNPKYEKMSNESKIIYTLLRDLVSLSIQNKWINENNEVYVKFSRTKLAEKVNVSPTNKKKMSALMKELKDLDLIVEKPVGLNKCNEIYVCIPEDLAIAYDPADLLGESELVEEKSIQSIEPQGGSILTTSGGSILTTSGGSILSTHINTKSINTNLTNKSSSSVSSKKQNEDEAILQEVISFYKECISKNVSSKIKAELHDLVKEHGKEKVMSAIKVTMDNATKPCLKYVKKVCVNGIHQVVSAKAVTAQINSKNPHFANTYSHNWDMEELERNEMERLFGVQ